MGWRTSVFAATGYNDATEIPYDAGKAMSLSSIVEVFRVYEEVFDEGSADEDRDGSADR